MQFNMNNFFCRKSQKLIAYFTYSLINSQVRITEWDLSSCSGKVPKLQQLLVQRGFLYGKTKVAIGTPRVKAYLLLRFCIKNLSMGVT